jgi:DNA polymerase-3 subunit epsilon
MTISDLEAMALALESSGEFRVLRRLKSPPLPPAAPDTLLQTGLVVDVETTGLDPNLHEIIELAMTPFCYGPDGTVYDVGESFQALRQPSKPIPPEITAMNRITDAMVAGKVIDPADVAAFAAPAAVVIAHNARFDRRFLERFCDLFKQKPWACSQNEINWAAEGYEGTKLLYLTYAAGFFYEQHRAIHDCMATIQLLTQPLRSGGTALNQLLTTARRSTWRIWAVNSPYDLKDILKGRGYRWNRNGRAWYVDVADARREAELHFLKTEIYRRDVKLPVVEIDAHNRFSDRC